MNGRGALRPGGRALLRALTRPQTLLAAVAFVLVCLAALPGGGGARTTRAPAVELEAFSPAELEAAEVRLVLFDERGLETPTMVRLELPDQPAARLSVVLTALRQALVERGVWPEQVPEPLVFLEAIDRRRVAVLDFRPESPPALSVGAELRLLRSVTATALENGADEVRFLLDGEGSGVFLAHVAVPSGL